MITTTYQDSVLNDQEIWRKAFRMKLIAILDRALASNATDSDRIIALQQLQSAIWTGKLLETK